METNKTVFASTELLTKAFSIIYDDIFRKSTLEEISKASDIIHPLNDAIEAVADFGLGTETVYIVNRIKEQCKLILEDSNNKYQLMKLLDDVLKMTIISEKLSYIYCGLIEHFRDVTDQE